MERTLLLKLKAGIYFVPLGGVGEIGMNLGLYGHSDGKKISWIMVDCGISFAGPELPGVDIIMPDVAFAVENRKNILAIFLTHAHEDHFGAIQYLWSLFPATVYATPFTAGLLEAKLSSEPNAPKVVIEEIRQGASVDSGPFRVTYVPVSHSIPEPNALLIEADGKRIMHTGDWKLDPEPGIGLPTDPVMFEKIGNDGVDVLVCDSTNAPRDGESPSEADVEETLAKLIADSPHRVAVTTFASNVARVQAIARAAKRADRDVVLLGRALHRAVTVAREAGYLQDIPQFLEEDAFGYLPRDKVVAICTGSQGEARAAIAKIADGSHRNVLLSPGDRIIFSSRAIPGNEKAVNGVINRLVDAGLEVLTDKDALVHVSGHPRKNELRQMYDWLKPRAVVPVHGEAYHLHSHAELAKSCGVKTVVEARNGSVVQLTGETRYHDAIESGILVRDGDLIRVPAMSGTLERRKLSFVGIVSVSVVIDGKGEVLAEPEVIISGLPYHTDEDEDLDLVIGDTVDEILDNLPRTRRKDPSVVREAVRRGVRSLMKEVWGKKPECHIMVTQIA